MNGIKNMDLLYTQEKSAENPFGVENNPADTFYIEKYHGKEYFKTVLSDSVKDSPEWVDIHHIGTVERLGNEVFLVTREADKKQYNYTVTFTLNTYEAVDDNSGAPERNKDTAHLDVMVESEVSDSDNEDGYDHKCEELKVHLKNQCSKDCRRVRKRRI